MCLLTPRPVLDLVSSHDPVQNQVTGSSETASGGAAWGRGAGGRTALPAPSPRTPPGQELGLSLLTVSWVCPDASAPERCPLCHRDVSQVCPGGRQPGDSDGDAELRGADAAHPGRVWGRCSGEGLTGLRTGMSACPVPRIPAGRAQATRPTFRQAASSRHALMWDKSVPSQLPPLCTR